MQRSTPRDTSRAHGADGSTGIVVRHAHPSWTRLAEDRERLRFAVRQLQQTVRQLTPAGRIRAQPLSYVVGGFVVGLILGVSWGRRS